MYNRYLYYKLLSNSARKKRPGARIIQASNKIVGCIIISKGTVAALFQADSFAPDCVSPISPGECKRASVVTGYQFCGSFQQPGMVSRRIYGARADRTHLLLSAVRPLLT